MRTRMTSDERRAAIVASAIHLFAEKGFRGTTTRELAAALGVTEPVLYQHFATKSDLYDAIMEAKVAAGLRHAEDLAERVEYSDDRAFFTRLAELILESHYDDPEFIRLLLYSALEGHELAERFYETHVVRFHEMVTGYIRRRIREGAFRDANPSAAAHSFVGMVGHHAMHELLFSAHAGKSARRNKKLIEDVVTIFLDGIHSNGAPK